MIELFNKIKLIKLILMAISLLYICPNILKSEELPTLNDSDVKNGKIVRNEVVEKDSLYLYLNGSADLFQEYGFEKLYIQEIQLEGRNIYRVEIFQMKDSSSSFGIFSVSRFNCLSSNETFRYNCETSHKLHFVSGRYYVSISNNLDATNANDYSMELANSIHARINNMKVGFLDYEIPMIFKMSLFEPHFKEIKHVKGHLGMQNGFIKWAGLFDNINGFNACIYVSHSSEGYVFLAELEFATEDELSLFYRKAGFRDAAQKTIYSFTKGRTSHSVRELIPPKIIYLESNLPKEKLKPYQDAVYYFDKY